MALVVAAASLEAHLPHTHLETGALPPKIASGGLRPALGSPFFELPVVGFLLHAEPSWNGRRCELG